MTNKEILSNFQNRIEIVLEKEVLDRIEELSLSTTHGWVNACSKYNVKISQEDIDSIEEELSICEEYC